jgi:hypothetical protein
MHRLGGAVISEANPMVTSSAAKEESLSDMLKVVSKYANIIVMRHFNDVEARQAAPYSESPLINKLNIRTSDQAWIYNPLSHLWPYRRLESVRRQRRPDRSPYRPLDGSGTGPPGR